MPGQDAQVGQPPDERVGGRLEHADEERAVLVGRDLDGRAGLVGRRGRRLVGRGGEVADDRVEQRRAGRCPWPRCRPGPARGSTLLDALAEAGLELRVGDLLALEVLRQDVVVGLGRGLEQLVAAARDLVGQLVRDRDLDLLRAVPASRPCGGRGRRSRERLGRADRELERRDLVPERRAQRVERGRRVGVLAVALVDEEAGRRARSRGRARPPARGPASTPAEASITKSAPSAAAKPSMTSATKSG